VRVVFVTCPAAEVETIAGAVLDARLAACVNTIPAVTSRYWWQGKLHTDTESMLVMKTSDACAEALVEAVKRAHSYDVPEVICMDVREANPDYLAWVEESCRPPADEAAAP
jgi:periplasmic divalent cation tolerance protein